MKNMNIKITHLSYYLMDILESYSTLSTKINKSEQWIILRTGVKERRISEIDVD